MKCFLHASCFLFNVCLIDCDKPNVRISSEISLLIGPSHAVCCLAQ